MSLENYKNKETVIAATAGFAVGTAVGDVFQPFSNLLEMWGWKKKVSDKKKEEAKEKANKDKKDS